MRVIQISILVAILLAITMPKQIDSRVLENKDLLKVAKAYEDTLASRYFIFFDGIMKSRHYSQPINHWLDEVRGFDDALENYMQFLRCRIECDSCKTCQEGTVDNLCRMNYAINSMTLNLIGLEVNLDYGEVLIMSSLINMRFELLVHLYNSTPEVFQRYCTNRYVNIEKILKPGRILDLSNFKWDSDSTNHMPDKDSTSDNR